MTMGRSYDCNGKLNDLARSITAWRESKAFQTKWSNVPEKLMLTVTELSEAMEAYRHIPQNVLVHLHEDGLTKVMHTLDPEGPDVGHVLNFEEELADTLIRLLDLTAALGIDIEAQVKLKMEINEGRPERHGKTC